MAMMDGWSMNGDGWVALILLFTLVAVAVAAFVVDSGRDHSSRGGPSRRPETPDAEPDRILERRFAAGEIDEDEYLRRRSLLHDRY
jgi:putative membrane protein